jgi:hypothetical protein
MGCKIIVLMSSGRRLGEPATAKERKGKTGLGHACSYYSLIQVIKTGVYAKSLNVHKGVSSVLLL